MKSKPLIHILSNKVTLNDTVNTVLALGGRAICADASEEAAEITEISDALLLNMGTPSAERLKTMLISGRRANELGIPVLLDPVGAGASVFRREMIKELLDKINFTCIKGNYSEISYICGNNISRSGVDSINESIGDEDVRKLAKKLRCIIAASGASDILSDGSDILKISGGSAFLEKLTGTGCMLSAAISVYMAKRREVGISDVASCMRDFKRAARRAEENMLKTSHRGSLAYRIYLMDELDRLGDENPGIQEKPAGIREE